MKIWEKLLDKYYIFTKIEFVWLLMEINRFIVRKEIASEIRMNINILYLLANPNMTKI